MVILVILFVAIAILILVLKNSNKKEEIVNNQEEFKDRDKEIRNNLRDASFYPQIIDDAKELSEIITNDVIHKGKSSTSRIYESVCYFYNGKICFRAPNNEMTDGIDYRLLGYDFKQDSCHMYSEMVGKLIKEFGERKCDEVYITFKVYDNVDYSNYGDEYYILNIIVGYPKKVDILKII